MGMGFTQTQAMQALQVSNGNLNNAVDLLMQGAGGTGGGMANPANMAMDGGAVAPSFGGMQGAGGYGGGGNRQAPGGMSQDEIALQ